MKWILIIIFTTSGFTVEFDDFESCESVIDRMIQYEEIHTAVTSAEIGRQHPGPEIEGRYCVPQNELAWLDAIDPPTFSRTLKKLFTWGN